MYSDYFQGHNRQNVINQIVILPYIMNIRNVINRIEFLQPFKLKHLSLKMNKILLTIILYFSQTFAFQGVPDFEYPFDESFKSLRMGNNFDVSSCSVAASRREDIKTYASVVRQIFEATQPGGAFEGKTYSDLGIFVDKFGSRLSGSEALERSIDFMVKEMEKSGLTNTHTEDAPVPKWER